MARRLSSLLVPATAAVVLGMAAAAIAAAPSAHAADSPSAAATASSWIDTVNWYRSMAHVSPVVEEPAWSDGLAHHLGYLHDTPSSLKTGTYASAHTENPASPAYTADGAAAGASADIYFGASASEQATVDAWMAAPFHAIGILRSNLQRAGYAATSAGAALDVIRGLNGPASSEPVLWPGDGSDVGLSQAGPESPNPLQSCPGFTAPAGLPLIALLPSDPGAGTTATLRLPDGRTLRQGADLCVITAATFHSNDATYGPAAVSVLKGDHAVVVIPRTPLQPGVYSATLTVPGRPAISWSFTQNPAAHPPAPAAAVPGRYNPVVGQRLLDTRAGIGAVAGKVAPGQIVRLVVAGRAVPAGTEAVVLNITATEPDAAGFVTVFPCGSAPLASNLNYRAGQTIANLSVVGLDAAGAVCLTSMSRAHLIADLNGFFPTGAGFHGTVPARLLDTRAGVGAPAGRLAAGGVVTLPITGRPEAGIPADASAVVLNVTATEPEAAGFVTVWPCDQPPPAASNLNVDGGATVPNLVIAPVSADGTVCLSTMSGLQLLADVEGWFGADAPYHGVNPVRLLDTRSTSGGARVAAGQTVELAVAGAAPADADAVVINVTAAASDGGGFVTVWPCGAPRPNASNLNVGNGDTRPNLVVSKVGDGGRVCLYTSSPTHLVVDFEGSFSA